MQHMLKGPFTAQVVMADNKKIHLKYLTPGTDIAVIDLELTPNEAAQIGYLLLVYANSTDNLSRYGRG